MIDRIYNYMTANNMVEEGSRILVAVSGGADSMCLLEVLRELQPRAGLQLKVFHVHHGLRESAAGDLDYVAEYCERADIPFEAAYVDAAGFAGDHGLSVEEAARQLRYEALEKAADQWDREQLPGNEHMPESEHMAAIEHMPGSKDIPEQETLASRQNGNCRIAVAHHREDQAETVLFNLVRGSRLTGLRGMLPVSGRIIRPLLTCSRREIEEFLAARGISWREDETNEDVRYSRNLLRRRIIPLLEQINKGAQEHIVRASEEVAEAEEFLRTETEKAAEECRIRRESSAHRESRAPEEHTTQGENVDIVSVTALLRYPPLIRRRVVYGVIADLAGRKKDLRDKHVQAVLQLAQKNGNGQLDVFGGVRVEKVYDRLLFYAGNTAATAASRRWPMSAAEYECRVLDFDGDMAAVSRKQYTKWFDYDKIGAFPSFRTRRGGDRITLDESGRSKTIARYMIDAKVPAQLRDRIVLPTIGGEILWIPAGAAEAPDSGNGNSSDSGRISAAYMVSEHTSRILEIRWKAGNNPEAGNGPASEDG